MRQMMIQTELELDFFFYKDCSLCSVKPYTLMRYMMIQRERERVNELENIFHKDCSLSSVELD